MNLFSLHVLDVRSHRFFHQPLLEVLWSLHVTRGVPGVVRGLLIGAVLSLSPGKSDPITVMRWKKSIVRHLCRKDPRVAASE